MYVPLAFTTTEPWRGSVLPVTVSPAPPSFVKTVAPLSTLLTTVVALSFTANGFTVISTVAVDACPAASVAV